MRLVTASVIAWNDRAYLLRCLASLVAQRGVALRIFVVDNGSTDGCAEAVRRDFPEVAILSPRENLGYAGAHNLTFSATDDPYFLVLNADVDLEEGYVARLVDAMEADPGLGAVSGKLLRADAPVLLDSAGIVPDARGRFRDAGTGLPDDGRVLDSEVFGVCGAAALYRRASVIDAVPDVPGAGRPFDAAFFAYYEDADIAWALRRRGWRARIVAGARGRHVRGGSRADPTLVERLLHRNAFWVFVKHARIRDLARVAPGLLFYEIAKLAQSLTYKPFLWRAQWERFKGFPAMWHRRSALQDNAKKPFLAPKSRMIPAMDVFCRPCAKRTLYKWK
jgi:GT2 family glycosyltransferase